MTSNSSAKHLNQSKSPNRAVLKPINEEERTVGNNKQLGLLNTSNEQRRDELNEFYNDMRVKMEKLRAGNQDMVLSAVLPAPTNQMSRLGNSTYVIDGSKLQLNRSKLPARSPAVTGVNNALNNNLNVAKSPAKLSNKLTTTAKVTYPSNLMPFNQKRKLLAENREKFERDLQNVRRKILTRKFAYIWLRRHFYSVKSSDRPSRNTLLPSQIE
jgi:hypothetical protein